jgi:hypothetical protein
MGRPKAAEIDVEVLAEILTPHVLKPGWIQYNEKLNSSIDSENILAVKDMWQDMAKGIGMLPLKKTTCEAAFKIVLESKLSLPKFKKFQGDAEKQKEWAQVCASRLRAQCRAINQTNLKAPNRGWLNTLWGTTGPLGDDEASEVLQETEDGEEEDPIEDETEEPEAEEPEVEEPEEPVIEARPSVLPKPSPDQTRFASTAAPHNRQISVSNEPFVEAPRLWGVAAPTWGGGGEVHGAWAPLGESPTFFSVAKGQGFGCTGVLKATKRPAAAVVGMKRPAAASDEYFYGYDPMKKTAFRAPVAKPDKREHSEDYKASRVPASIVEDVPRVSTTSWQNSSAEFFTRGSKVG